MKPQIWDRTIIVWEMNQPFGIETNIPVDDWHEKKVNYVHTLHELRAISMPDKEHIRKGIIQLQFMRVAIGPTTMRSEIISRLQNLDSSILDVSDGRGFCDFFTITYQLRNGESFCESAFEKVEFIFKSFGVKDEKHFILSNFMPIRETLVKTKKDGWIPFGDYLRSKLKLPQLCGLHGRKMVVDDLIISINYKKSPSNFFH